MRRVVGVGMGLPCHDGEVEGVVVEDDAVLVLGVRGRARYANRRWSGGLEAGVGTEKRR